MFAIVQADAGPPVDELAHALDLALGGAGEAPLDRAADAKVTADAKLSAKLAAAAYVPPAPAEDAAPEAAADEAAPEAPAAE